MHDRECPTLAAVCKPVCAGQFRKLNLHVLSSLLKIGYKLMFTLIVSRIKPKTMFVESSPDATARMDTLETNERKQTRVDSCQNNHKRQFTSNMTTSVHYFVRMRVCARRNRDTNKFVQSPFNENGLNCLSVIHLNVYLLVFNPFDHSGVSRIPSQSISVGLHSSIIFYFSFRFHCKRNAKKRIRKTYNGIVGRQSGNGRRILHLKNVSILILNADRSAIE